MGHGSVNQAGDAFGRARARGTRGGATDPNGRKRGGKPVESNTRDRVALGAPNKEDVRPGWERLGLISLGAGGRVQNLIAPLGVTGHRQLA